MEHFEATYDKVLTTVFSVTNPFKKAMIKTQCEVHKSININALKILKNDKYFKEYQFFNNHISHINKGAVWADQDYKSSSHFYNPFKRKGYMVEKMLWNLVGTIIIMQYLYGTSKI